MNRLLIAGVVVCCAAVAFGATPPTAANMKLDWSVNPVVFEKDAPTPKPVIVLLDFTQTGVDPYAVQGWSLGLCVDKTKVKVDAATLGDGAREWTRKDPDNQQPWTRVNVLADGTGITCGVVIDFNGVVKVPTGTGFKALNATLSNVGLVSTTPPAVPDSTKIVNCATLGSPPVIPVVVVEGTSISFGTAVDLVVQRAQGVVVEDFTDLTVEAAAPCYAVVKLVTGKYPVDAVSFGLSHTGNPNPITVERGAATTNADFFGSKVVAGGITLGIVMDLDGVLDKRLPASKNAVEIAKVKYEAAAAGTTSVAFSNSLGTPPVDIVVDSGGTPIPAADLRVQAAAATVTLCVGIPPERFVRGDANQDNQVNISDGVYIARHLFGLVPDKGCADAIDTNNDEVLDPADPIYLLNYLFIGGPAILPPVPANLRAIVAGDCGPDPAGDALKCPTTPPVCR